MIATLAWRNIWRSPLRSLVVILAIALGVWALIFLMGISRGMISGYVKTAIEERVSHIQIHEPQFKDDKDVNFVIPNASQVMADIRSEPFVKGASDRILASGMIATAKGARGVQIFGIDPAGENELTGLADRIAEGDYLDADKRNAIVLGDKLAKKLNVKVRSKVVLTFQNKDRQITSAAFRIVGLLKLSNANLEEANIYVRNSDLQRLLGSDGDRHEIAILLNDLDDLDMATNSLKAQYPDLLVEDYTEISPDLELYSSQLDTSLYVFILIVMLALIFGIINTMLMAVLERIKELGMLMAIGMTKGRVFLMIMLETIMLGMVGAPIGILLSYLSIKGSARNGIDLSDISSGFEQFGMSSHIFPEVEASIYINVGIAVAITALLASIYPAIKAIKLKPVEALRKL